MEAEAPLMAKDSVFKIFVLRENIPILRVSEAL